MKTGTWISLIALAVAIAALIIVICRIEPITMDWMGSLIGVLALLVTALIGWQVFNAIQLHITLKEINGRIKREIDDYDHTVSALVMQLFTIQEYFNKNHFEKAIDRFMEALGEAIKGSRSEEVRDGILSYLLGIKQKHDLYKEKELPSGIFIIKGKRDSYLEILSSVKNKEAKEIAEFISELEENDEFR